MPALYRRLALAFVLLVPTTASAQQLNWFWWKTEPTRTDLGITADQSTQIEVMFQEGIAQLRKQKEELDRLEGKLSNLIASMADEIQVSQQIDRVEAVRSKGNKTRTLMLFHMRQVLTPDQRVKLNALRDSRDRDRRAQEQRQRERDKQGVSPDGTQRPDGGRNRPN
jgi:Spy/CpxP family protein refolding chaperone